MLASLLAKGSEKVTVCFLGGLVQGGLVSICFPGGVG